jgi:DNA-binding CsgD family transcriptional regulator
MKLDPRIRKPWKIPKDLARIYNTRSVESALGLFNRASHGNFYMVDYYEQKLIVGSASASTFCGYSKDIVEIEGFGFYKRILLKNEMKWLAKMNEEAYLIYYNYPESERQNLEFSYDLIAKTQNKQEIVLRHKLVPYKLCSNGNMWLGLCHVTTSSFLHMFSKAHIANIQTGEQYDFIDGRFVPSIIAALSPDEVTILLHMAKDMQRKQIADALNISESSIKKKKQLLFDKLNVKTSAAAVYKATMLKII